jgi:hypothetical protein
VHEFEEAVSNGKYREAINSVIGFYVDAKAKKLEKISANPSTEALTANTPAQE